MATVLAEVADNKLTDPQDFYADENAVFGWLQSNDECASLDLPEALPQATERFLRSIYRRKTDREQDTMNLLLRAAIDIERMEDQHAQVDVRLMVAGLGAAAMKQVAPNAAESVEAFREVVRRPAEGASLRLVKTAPEAPKTSEPSAELATITSESEPELVTISSEMSETLATVGAGEALALKPVEVFAPVEPAEQTLPLLGEPTSAPISVAVTPGEHRKGPSSGDMWVEDLAELFDMTPKQVRDAIKKGTKSSEAVKQAYNASSGKPHTETGTVSRLFKAKYVSVVLDFLTELQTRGA